MRGRTNLSGGGGELSINGDVISATVAENNILAGDFVEYKTTTNTQELFSGIDMDFKRYIPLSESMYIAHIGDYLRLIDLSNNRVDIIYTLSSHVVNDFIMTGDNEFYAVCSTPASLIKFSVESNFILVSDTVSTPIGEETGITLFEIGNKICTVYPYTKGNAIQVSFSFYTFNKNRLQYDEKFEKTSSKIDKTISSSINEKYIMNYIFNKENYVFFNLALSYKTSSASSGTSMSKEYFIRFQIKDNQVISEDDTELRNEVDTQNIRYNNFLVFQDKYIIYQRTSGRYIYLYKYNIDTDTRESYDLESYGMSMSGQQYIHLCNIASIYNTKKFVVNCSSYYGATSQAVKDIQTAVFELTSAENIVLVSNILQKPYTGTLNALEIVLANNDNIFSITNETIGSTRHIYSNAYTHSVNYDRLSQPPDKTHVTPYSGGAAIGVAKGTGEVGKTIEIFVPKIIEA